MISIKAEYKEKHISINGRLKQHDKCISNVKSKQQENTKHIAIIQKQLS